MSDTSIYQAMRKLPDWMVDVSERFDEVVNKKVYESINPQGLRKHLP